MLTNELCGLIIIRPSDEGESEQKLEKANRDKERDERIVYLTNLCDKLTERNKFLLNELIETRSIADKHLKRVEVLEGALKEVANVANTLAKRTKE